ncbi:S8 family serine peptidase [Bacillus toyonensis]|uniref:Uncharacterized protein n=1 Tax=Bacillus toyonensis TaxID=155322 RepID=A0A2A8HHY9_9BACI|nr:S8 family serine peptidase [Bacillus toyonensis]PEQ08689.1 hypothetical protein CN585_08010 [Bacillus toyonensis]
MFKEGQLLITFYDHTNSQAKSEIYTQLGGNKIDEISQLHLELIEVPVGEEAKYKALYEQHSDVRFVEYNFIRKLRYKSCTCAKCNYKRCGCIPNDPYYLKKIETSRDGLQNQWGLQRINPEQGFCKVKNRKPSTKIAILDSGIDPNHPDLKDKIINPINFTSDDPEDYLDTVGHGTFVAGIAAAATNNQIGIASASYNTAYIVPVKILGGGDSSFTLAILKGLMYAIEQKVDVINMSFGTEFEGTYSRNEQEVLEMAWNQGIISVAARGNESNERITYPDAYNYVLAVSATNKLDRLATFSSWGINVGITAPGTEILSITPTYLVPGPNYDTGQGTSFSAPFVCGVAAMLRAIKPSASNQEIIQAIQRSSRSLNTNNKEWSPFYGYGLLDLSAAVQEIKCPQIPYGDYCEISGSFYGQVVNKNGQALGNIRVTAVDNRTGTALSSYMTKPDTTEGPFPFPGNGMFRLFNLPAGNYSIYLRFVDPRTRVIESIDIVPGADVYVKLVFPGFSEDIISVLKNSE